MNAVIYYLFLKPISWMPFPIMYAFSDLLYLVLYYVISFRKKVVRNNLKRSFPDKHMHEIRSIERKFYRHLSDIFLESFKLFSISESQIRNRFKKRNPDVMNQLFEAGKSVVVVGGHYNNWEMAGTSFGFDLKHKILGIYNPFSNKYFEKKTKQSRSRFGVILVPNLMTLRYMVRYKDQISATVFGIDQSPPSHKNIFWFRFLNQDTAWFMGAEKYACKFNDPVVYAHFIKVKRGYYEMEFELVEEHPTQTAEGEITEKFVRILENEIREQPEYWLWSHRRWKRKRENTTNDHDFF